MLRGDVCNLRVSRDVQYAALSRHSTIQYIEMRWLRLVCRSALDLPHFCMILITASLSSATTNGVTLLLSFLSAFSPTRALRSRMTPSRNISGRLAVEKGGRVRESTSPCPLGTGRCPRGECGVGGRLHITSTTVSQKPRTGTVELCETTVCFLLRALMGMKDRGPTSATKAPEVDLGVSIQPAGEASE